MATTDAKSGFRLPWSADRNESESQADGTVDAAPVGDPAEATAEAETTAMTEGTTPTPEIGSDATPEASSGTSTSPSGSVARKPNKFMADLTKAMQAAAEAARADTLERFSAEAKAHIESIHASTADEATGLRKKADDDIAAIRDWSKTEIARIREETDERIAHRKDVLDREIETHAAQIEERIERVQHRVASFESQMAAFFERLLAEDDPTRFAAMAETLPEPPPFDADAAWSEAVAETPAAAAVAEAPVETAPAETAAEWGTTDMTAPGDTTYETSTPEVTAEAETPAVTEDASETSTELIGEAQDTHSASTYSDGYVEAVPTGWGEPTIGAPTPETTATATATAEDTGDLFGMTADEPAQPETDPRLDALGINADFAAAEAEAGGVPAESESTEDEIPVIADDALAARLAGLVPDTTASGESATTRVVVTGLVSVASIAGFKRNLARVSGVHSVGVTSGPDGEFVFAVTHDPGMALGESIATLPGFGARVTNEADGELTVAARDPEAEG
jgi:hypothetical protein